MADYAPNFTARIRVRYTAHGRQHSQTWRVATAGAGDVNIGLGVVAIGNYYADIQDNLVDNFAILNTTFAREGSDIFLPSVVAVTVAPAGGTATPGAERREATQVISFVGRTANGLRAIIYQYGFVHQKLSVESDTASDDFRIQAAEDPTIATVTTDLNGILNVLCGNDGADVTWYPYCNIKYNDYWVRKVRQGS